jgi:hypothetical protein
MTASRADLEAMRARLVAKERRAGERTCEVCGVAFCKVPMMNLPTVKACSAKCAARGYHHKRRARECSARAEAPSALRSGPLRLADISDADLVRLVDEMPPGQIAQRLGVSEARVRQRLSRSRRTWRDWSGQLSPGMRAEMVKKESQIERECVACGAAFCLVPRCGGQPSGRVCSKQCKQRLYYRENAERERAKQRLRYHAGAKTAKQEAR